MTAWGSKITISIYVEGESSDGRLAGLALFASDKAYSFLENSGCEVEYVGAKVETVDEKPQDQDAR